MYTITLTVCEQQEVEDILHALSEAEEDGLITFPFQTEVVEMSFSETESWKRATRASIEEKIESRRQNQAGYGADQFESESRN